MNLAPFAVALALVVVLLPWCLTSRPSTVPRHDHIVSQTDRLGARADSAQSFSPDPPEHETDVDRIRGALLASGIFAKTDADTVSALSGQLDLMSLPAGYVVDDWHTFGNHLYVIASGKVKVSFWRPDGYEVVLTVLGPSEIFGALTLFDEDAEELSVTTLTRFLAVPIPRDQLLRWMVERQEVSDQVLRLFARWVKHTSDALVALAFADVRSRIANHLLLCTKRFGRREGDVVRVVHDLTLRDFSRLVGLVGVAPRTVDATLRDFQSRGWIRLDGDSVAIVDGQALRSVSATKNAETPGMRCV